MEFWALDENHQLYRTTDIAEYARVLEKFHRIGLAKSAAGVRVSTVFLGGIVFDRPELLFETMVFDDVNDSRILFVQRYATWQEAEDGHRRLMRAYDAEPV